ncbi:calcium-binding protein, partial [Cribrihabitans sp. XS_ASV171]
MTKYVLSGFRVDRNLADDVTNVEPTTLSILTNSGDTQNFTYTITRPPNAEDFLPEVEIDRTAPDVTMLDGLGDINDDVSAELGQVTWAGGTTQVLVFSYGPPGIGAQDWIFRIGGAPLPAINSETDFAALEASITGGGAITSGPLAPGAQIPLGSLAGIATLPGELLTGTTGDDDLVGTAGDDFINPVDNNQSNDQVRPGTGQDTVTFEDAQNGYFELLHSDLAAGITANIDGQAGTGSIDKGAGGTTSLLFVDRAMNAEGMGVIGTDSDDVFNVTATNEGFVQVAGLGGNDTFNIDPSAPTSRIDYIYGSPSTGITANLVAGTINDGSGGTDTVNGSLRELRATDLADSILGSDADERFILRRGNDTLDAGGGTDWARYDRIGVEAIDVDLQAGTATGIWRGDAFTHQLLNVENIRGSRDANDMLRGDGQSNMFRGEGGNDTLEGRGGDDILVGEMGDDRVDGGDGNDQAAFWGLNRADATITQNTDGSIQVVSALGTDTLVNIESLGFQDQFLLVSDLFPPAGPILGTNGDDDLVGTAGDDFINPLDNMQGLDVITPGTGNDTVSFENAANGYFEIRHNDLTQGITVNIDGQTGAGSIDKGAGNGTTSLLFFDRAMNADGLGVMGTDHDDVFNVKPTDDGYVQVAGQGGFDTYNIDPAAQTSRIDYAWASMSGITADLSTGVVSNDGFGSSDQINGPVHELRATNLNDNILGSDADERFILRGGNDTLDGAGGNDWLRYDRNDYGRIELDLAAGTVSGGWRGEVFNHQIANIENVRGSRANDLLQGDGRNNQLRGDNGNDTIEGRGGEDILVGQAGDDLLNGGDGLDRADFWDVNQADATITQNGDGSIQVVSALGTDTLIDVEELGFADALVRVADLFPQPGVVVGSNGDERLDGSTDPENVTAGGGNDEVNGDGGDDTIEGGTGNDTLRGGDGDDSINGGDGNDTVNAGEGNDNVTGGESPDDLRDVIYGG